MIEEFEPLINYGVLGIVLAWFMFRMEKIIKSNTDAIINLSQIIAHIRKK